MHAVYLAAVAAGGIISAVVILFVLMLVQWLPPPPRQRRKIILLRGDWGTERPCEDTVHEHLQLKGVRCVAPLQDELAHTVMTAFGVQQQRCRESTGWHTCVATLAPPQCQPNNALTLLDAMCAAWDTQRSSVAFRDRWRTRLAHTLKTARGTLVIDMRGGRDDDLLSVGRALAAHNDLVRYLTVVAATAEANCTLEDASARGTVACDVRFGSECIAAAVVRAASGTWPSS